jgi:hypothetical protein
MALLSNQTFYNPTTSFFGAGGGSTSTLQSPASITPDVNGESSLSLQSPANAGIFVEGAPTSILALSSAASQTSISNQGDGVLKIQQGSSPATPPIASFDVVGNIITLGNPILTAGQSNKIVLQVAPTPTFTPTVVTSTTGTWDASNNTIALAGFARGMYVIYGDSGASTNPIDLECRPNSIFVIDPAFTVSGGGGGADTNWNLSPNGIGGLTLNLVTAPTSAFSMKVMPLYLF